jgi:hypothetical protein
MELVDLKSHPLGSYCHDIVVVAYDDDEWAAACLERIAKFATELTSRYGDEHMRQFALFHVMSGSGVEKVLPFIDYPEEEYSVVTFLERLGEEFFPDQLSRIREKYGRRS